MLTAALRTLSTVGLVLVAGALPGLASEEEVRFAVEGQTVVGTLTLPDGDLSAPPPVVLMLYGFLGHRAEWPVGGTQEGTFERTARIWAENGVASLRIDYRGSGESDGDFADATIASEIADGVAAVEFLRNEPRVDVERLGIVGWSLGGLVAISVGAETDPDALALWAAVADPVETFTALLGEDIMKAGRDRLGEPLSAVMPWGEPIEIGQAMINEFHTHDPAAELARYTGPLLLAQGSTDVVVRPRGADILLAAHEGEEEAYRPEMDHMFSTEHNTVELDALIARTAVFLAEHL